MTRDEGRRRRPRGLTTCVRCAVSDRQRDEALQLRNDAFRMLIVVLTSLGGRFEMTDAQLRALPSARVLCDRDADRLLLAVEFDPHDVELH